MSHDHGAEGCAQGTLEACYGELRALARNVILGTVVVILASLAVPVLLIRAEYQQDDGAPAASAPAIAEVLREGRSDRPAITPRRPALSDIPKLAEELVRKKVDQRATVRSRTTPTTDVPVRPAPARPVPAAAPVVKPPNIGIPQVSFPRSMESP